MAAQGGNSSAGIITIIIGAVLVLILFVVGLSGSGNNNAAQGATAPQAVNLANPVDLSTVNDVKQLADPSASITSLKKNIAQIQTDIQNLQNKVGSWGLSATSQSQIQFLLGDSINQLRLINNTQATDSTNLQKYRNKLYTDAVQIQKILTASNPNSSAAAIINQATKLASINIESGYKAYPYVYGGDLTLDNPPKSTTVGQKSGVDCSGFITYLMKFGGIMPPSTGRMTTSDSSDWSKYFTNINIAASSSNGELSSSSLKAVLQPGDIINNAGVHMAMYIGTATYKDEPAGDDMIESGGSSGGPNGIIFTSLKGLLAYWYNANGSANISVYRPNYTQK